MMAARMLVGLVVTALSAGAFGGALDDAAPIKWQWSVMIPLRDGVKLHATLYQPREQREPLPCVFTLTPYVAQTYHERGVYFASHGYVFLTVDVRGRGNSGGKPRLFRQEAQDGYDVVEWLARQPYCNGKVAMWGGSYAGANQWTVAGQNPPHLATIVPAASGFAGVDFPFVNNIASAYLMQWLTLVSGHTLQMSMLGDASSWAEQLRHLFETHAPFIELDRNLGNPSPVFQEWLAHPRVDDYWDSYNPSASQYAAIDFPVLTITGQYDSDQPGALAHYRHHLAARGAAARDRHFLIIGPWNHSQTRTPQREVNGLALAEASMLDLNDLHRQWYDWTMKSGGRPEFLQKPIAYYVTGSEQWRYADSLAAFSQESALYLTSQDGNANDVFASGRLQPEAPADSPGDSYVYDPLDVSDAQLQIELDPDSLIEQRDVLLAGGKSLVYHSAPLPMDTEVSGFFRLNAWIALDQPDTDFSARIYEINSSGASLLLTATMMRARYRESLRYEKLVPRGEVLEYRFDQFPFVARRLARGSRLRLVVGPVNSIYTQKNYNSGGVVARETAKDARTVTVRLLHDAQHRSVLFVPKTPAN